MNQIRRFGQIYHVSWLSTLTVILGISLAAFMTSPLLLIVILFGFVSAVSSSATRRVLLAASCLLNIFFVNTFYLPVAPEAWHLLPFLVFNFVFVMVADRLELKKGRYLIAGLGVLVAIVCAQTWLAWMGVSVKNAILISAPLASNFWTYVNYLKQPTKGLTLIERVIWLRPFWYRWVIPYGGNHALIPGLLSRANIQMSEVAKGFRVVILVSLAMFIYENLVFKVNAVFPRVSWIPHIFELPLVYRDGYLLAMQEYASRSAADAGDYDQLRKSIYYLAIQSAATIQFMFLSSLFSAIAISSARLAGFKVELHVRDFWNAKNFGDFYFRTNHHFANLIRDHLMPRLARFKPEFLSTRLRQAMVIAGSVFIVSSIGMYIGRGTFAGRTLAGGAPQFEGRLHLFFANYHYSLLTAVVCALHVFVRKKELRLPTIWGEYLLKCMRLAIYFFLFQFTLIFGFHFLKTSPEVKLEFALQILKLFYFETYI